MRAVAHAHQDWPDLKPAAFHLQNVAYTRCGIGVCKDQRIGRPFHPPVRQDACAQFRIKGGVDVHFALVGKITRFRVQNGDGFAHPCAGPPRLIAKLRLRAQGDFWVQPETAHVARCPLHNLSKFLCRGFHMHMGVRDKQRPVFQYHHR